MKAIVKLAAALLLVATAAQAGPPAARVGDPGQPGFHAQSAILNGSANVMINGVPAAQVSSKSSCPQVCVVQVFPPIIVPHSQGVITTGSATVFINGLPAARVGDAILESETPGQCQPLHSVSQGSANVFVGP